MNGTYPKPYMSISEIVLLGLSRDYLKQLSRADGAPIIKTMGGGKIYFKTAELDSFMIEVTNRSRKRSLSRR